MRDFKVVWEDSDPQRLILIEDFDNDHEIILIGDDYHDGILSKVEGFKEALDYLDTSYSWSVAEVIDFGSEYIPIFFRNSQGGFSYKKGNVVIDLEFKKED